MTMHDETPDDIRDIAGQLEALGKQERRDAEEACRRVAMRTAHLLHDKQSSGAGVSPASGGGVGVPTARETFRRLLLWIGTPALAAAAVLLVVLVMSPNPATAPESNGIEVLAASIESDIDAWLELDAMWAGDSFESTLAALSMDAAGLASQSASGGSLDSYPDLESDL